LSFLNYFETILKAKQSNGKRTQEGNMKKWFKIGSFIFLVLGSLSIYLFSIDNQLDASSKESKLHQENSEIKKALADAKKENSDLKMELGITKNQNSAIQKELEIAKNKEGILNNYSDMVLIELKQLNFDGTPEDIIADLLKHPELIPYEAILGGQMGFSADSKLLSHQWVFASFSDGHILGIMLLKYSIKDGKIDGWKVMDSYLY
jgi:hypothetical protein